MHFNLSQGDIPRKSKEVQRQLLIQYLLNLINPKKTRDKLNTASESRVRVRVPLGLYDMGYKLLYQLIIK